MKHVFLINNNAGNGKKQLGLEEKIISCAEKCGVDYKIYKCKNLSDAADAINSYASCGERVRFYACGGDGTLSVTANLMYRIPDAEIAIIPVGSGNDFTRSFTFSENFSDIEKQIGGSAVCIDAISYSEKICLNLLNTGFDSAVVAETEKIKKHRFISGKTAYILGIIKCLLYLPHVNLEIVTSDGNVIKDTFLLLAVANGSFYGGGFMAAPEARLDDGLADILMVKRVSRLKFISLVSKYKKGKIYEIPDFDKIAKFIRAKEIKLTSDKEILISNDGELENIKCADIKVIKSAVRFVVPKGSELLNS